ncbi:MAG: non-heme iron oxygenase ferredoxin subunit [Actinomycetota bacterium]|nr:non-heme iron oxygenase ferredoxin subunit [Acidimicrobiia bacterium]MDQ3294471.1 non-heme iron oxygenase ferredoxin subunit [Actinomycetota bacterium]
MSTRIDVAALEDLAKCTAMRVDVDGHRIALVRIDDDEVYAIGDRCTHADFSLSEGEVDCEERTLECWKHGSQFSLDTGEPLSLPATKATPTYKAGVTDGRIWVELDR